MTLEEFKEKLVKIDKNIKILEMYDYNIIFEMNFSHIATFGVLLNNKTGNFNFVKYYDFPFGGTLLKNATLKEILKKIKKGTIDDLRRI